MKAFIYSELTTNHSSNQLEFQVERKTGKIFRVGYPVACLSIMALCALVALPQEYPPDWSVGIGIGATINLLLSPLLLRLARWNRFTVLQVNEIRFEARGRGVGGSPWSSGTISVPAAKIDWIGFLPSQQMGLYLSQGFMQDTCVLPGLNREQVAGVMETIFKRFPVYQPKKEESIGEARLRQAASSKAAYMATPTVSPTRMAQSSTTRAAEDSSSGITRFHKDKDSLIQGDKASSNKEAVIGFGRRDLTIQELPDELLFRMDYRAGTFETIVGPILMIFVIVVCFIPLYRLYLPLLPVTVIIGLGLCIFMMKKIKRFETVTLSVNSQRFEARGDNLESNWLGFKPRSVGQVTVPVAEIKSFGYSPGSEDTPRGFWVSCGYFKSKYLLPGLDRKQSTAVSIAIAQRFPEIASKAK